MVVEAAPPAPLVIAKAKFLFELLIIALDPPPQFDQIANHHLARRERRMALLAL
jgi:hypothetical protein